jgi:hypothetical protein
LDPASLELEGPQMSETLALYSRGFCPEPAMLIGVPQATLQTWLLDAQTAYQLMMISGQPQTVSYGQGDGQKSVTFSRSTNAGQLAAWIGMLQMALGIGCGRRAIRVQFAR